MRAVLLQYPGMPLQYSGILQHFPLLRQQYLAAHPLFSLPAADNNPTDMVTTATFGDEEILPLDILRSQNAVTLIKRRVKKPVFKKQTDDTADGIVDPY